MAIWPTYQYKLFHAFDIFVNTTSRLIYLCTHYMENVRSRRELGLIDALRRFSNHMNINHYISFPKFALSPMGQTFTILNGPAGPIHRNRSLLLHTYKLHTTFKVQCMYALFIINMAIYIIIKPWSVNCLWNWLKWIEYEHVEHCTVRVMINSIVSWTHIPWWSHL